MSFLDDIQKFTKQATFFNDSLMAKKSKVIEETIFQFMK